MAPTTPVLSRTLNPVPTRGHYGLFSTAVSGKRWRLFLAAYLSLISVAWAGEFRILSADTHLEQGVYLLSARIGYRLGDTPREALHNGVPLTIELTMEVVRSREWLWDETIAELKQRFRLEYHALSRQYLVTNLNSGEVKSFPSLSSATEFLGRINDFPLLDASLLEPDERYYGRLRTSLDIEALPLPLQPIAYLFANWRLISEWYTWPL